MPLVSANMPPRKRKSPPSGRGTKAKPVPRLYTLVVYIAAGPLGREFEDTVISRTIQIRGDQTLEDLHNAIFNAFDRDDPHLYEFNLGAGPDDRSAIYSLRLSVEVPEFDEVMAGDVRTTTIEPLGLEVDRTFGYHFDFGDDWMHEINVTAVEDSPGKGRYPKVIAREGKSPPQYPDIDEDED